MSEIFDPYYTWLGIPPKDHPPNLYRLLGIDLFESNSDVISNAADQRMGHVRAFQTGPHADLSQKILNQLAAARVCLLDPQKKAEYDQRLGQRIVTASIARNVAKSSAPISVAHSGNKKARYTGFVFGAVMAVGLVVVGFVAAKWGAGDSGTVAPPSTNRSVAAKPVEPSPSPTSVSQAKSVQPEQKPEPKAAPPEERPKTTPRNEPTPDPQLAKPKLAMLDESKDGTKVELEPSREPQSESKPTVVEGVVKKTEPPASTDVAVEEKEPASRNSIAQEASRIAEAAKQTRLKPEQRAALVESALNVMDEAIEKDKFAVAKQLGKQAIQLARSSNDKGLLQEVISLVSERFGKTHV